VPPSDQTGLPWCQLTCPVCQWQAAPFDFSAPDPATALNAGRWGGDPQRGLRPQARGGASSAPPAGQHMAAPDPFPGKGGPGAPEAGRSGLACDGPVITRGGPGPPRGGRVRRGYPRAIPPIWVCRDLGPHGARGRVRRPRSQLSDPETVCHVAQRRGGAWIMRSLRSRHPSGRYPYLHVPTGGEKRKKPNRYVITDGRWLNTHRNR
jgi:hypothetical protein